MKMGVLMSRRILGMAMAGLAILLAFGAAAQPAAVPAPERNLETGLVFPNMIGPARKVGSVDYSQTKAMPELGWAWNYETQSITTTFYIYNFGVGSIPPGATSGPVLTQFQQATADIEIGARAGRYEQLKPSQGPGNCTVGALVFRCITFTAVLPSDKRPVFTRLFVTGYRNYFLKIRQDWLQNSPAAAREAEAVIQAFASSAKP
jgi:hypothetical protein